MLIVGGELCTLMTPTIERRKNNPVLQDSNRLVKLLASNFIFQFSNIQHEFPSVRAPGVEFFCCSNRSRYVFFYFSAFFGPYFYLLRGP